MTNYTRSHKVEPMTKYYYSPLKQRIVMLLAGGLALGFSKSPRTHAKLCKNTPNAPPETDRLTFSRIIKEINYKRLIEFKEENDGTVSVVLSKLGQLHAFRYDPENIRVAIPAKWDGKWRVVIFDIPEKKKKARDALRWELKKIGFIELQKSVWIFPYECQNAVDFIVEVFDIRNHVRILEVSSINNDADLRLKFDLVQ